MCLCAERLLYNSPVAIQNRLHVQNLASTLHPYPSYADALQKVSQSPPRLADLATQRLDETNRPVPRPVTKTSARFGPSSSKWSGPPAWWLGAHQTPGWPFSLASEIPQPFSLPGSTASPHASLHWFAPSHLTCPLAPTDRFGWRRLHSACDPACEGIHSLPF